MHVGCCMNIPGVGFRVCLCVGLSIPNTVQPELIQEHTAVVIQRLLHGIQRCYSPRMLNIHEPGVGECVLSKHDEEGWHVHIDGMLMKDGLRLVDGSWSSAAW
jgi:hypothetical protein